LFGIRRIVARVHAEHVTPSPVQPGQHDDVGTTLKITEPLTYVLAELQPGLG
jgi:hypothetical protein